jgi:hypothetical protein
LSTRIRPLAGPRGAFSVSLWTYADELPARRVRGFLRDIPDRDALTLRPAPHDEVLPIIEYFVNQIGQEKSSSKPKGTK